MSLLRGLIRLLLVLSVGGLVPASLSPAGSTASTDRTRLATAARGHVDRLPALPRAHTREPGRLETSRKSPHGSALPASLIEHVALVVTSGTAPEAGQTLPPPAARSVHRLRGPPSLI